VPADLTGRDGSISGDVAGAVSPDDFPPDAPLPPDRIDCDKVPIYVIDPDAPPPQDIGTGLSTETSTTTEHEDVPVDDSDADKK
jgi:hypothetical protein